MNHFSSFAVFDGLNVWVIMVLLRTLNDVVGAADVLLDGFEVGDMIVLLGTLNNCLVCFLGLRISTKVVFSEEFFSFSYGTFSTGFFVMIFTDFCDIETFSAL